MNHQVREHDYSEDVHILEVEGREFILVGTAHISRESVDLVREVIEKERPDCVCLELDTQRYEALSHKKRWEALDLREVIRKKQLAALLMNLMLASYQKRLGGKLGVIPGSELLEAATAANELGIPISLCDRDIRVTLRRAWGALSIWKKSMLVSTFVASAFEDPELSEEELNRIKQKDVLSELMAELGEAMPALKTALIDERDGYLAQKIRDSSGERLVAVVGAGHVQGMIEAISANREIDLEEINTVPPVSQVWKWLGWGIPALILGSLATIGYTQGPEAAGDNAAFWFLANAVPCALGGLLAFAHPATVVAGFFAAPFTSLTPVVGAGYVTAFVQTWVRPPLVQEFQSVGDDMGSLRGWWHSRLLRIFLAFIFTTIGSLVGTWVGGSVIVANLF
ncbi:MAG: TraB/GumN family protein [Deltaproteobacteria bacterium]|nr:TraB/GumN family protein [Deltaproteobacteria bacterium]MBW2418447.1 TraB/GumN family protein [Deltaproteobacteria bacterium]